MRRLRDGQGVSLEVESLDTNLECLVVGVEGDEAILHPLYRAYSMSVPTSGTNSMLTFEHEGRLIMLRGRVRRADDTLEFKVTDRVSVPQRRRYARVDIALPIVLTPLNAEGKPYGQPVETRTRDVSADGVLVEAKISPDLPGLHISLPLPDGLPPSECNVRVVRQLGWGSGLRYSGISDETRARLKEFVAETKHLQLLDEQESEAAW